MEPRELLKRALLANAAGVVVYHNHPSGDPTPSREDRDFTRRLSARWLKRLSRSRHSDSVELIREDRDAR